LIYLDHNATTPVLPEVAEAMMPWVTTHWGNPSSNHTLGREARRAVENARTSVADLLGADPSQVVFTSGATEANNAVLHSAAIRCREKRHLVTSVVEHSGVLAYCDYLEKHFGFTITRLPVDTDGMLSLDDVQRAIRDDTALVSLMWANNETGVIWPIQEFAGICRDKGVSFHTDGVQGIGKLRFDVASFGSDFLSLSGHKIGVPKGIGALMIRDPSSFEPLIRGGKQESGLRGGTESVPLIVALGKAAEIRIREGFGCWKDVQTLRDEFESKILSRIPGSSVNGGRSERLPNTSNIHLPGVDSDAAVLYLDSQGICVSSGSACLEHAITPSHVVQEMTGSYDVAGQSIRLSFSASNATDDVNSAIEALTQIAILRA
jgi:cysteine desulfurase